MITMDEMVFDTEKGKQISLETLIEIYGRVSADLIKFYQAGCRDWSMKYRSELVQRIDEAEAGVNQIWLDCLGGSKNLDAFKAALRDWYKRHRAAIMAHTQYLQTEDGAAEHQYWVKRAMSGEKPIQFERGA